MFSNTKALAIPEGDVVKITAGGKVLWKKVTSRIPSAYQEVEWIQAGANVGAYINLGFSYDTGATIKLGQWVMNKNTAYPFGTTDSAGSNRCCLSIPFSINAHAYYYDTVAGSTSLNLPFVVNQLNHFVATYKAGTIRFENLTNGKSLSTDTLKSYTISANHYLFAQNYKSAPRFGDIRRISYFQYYDKTDTLICDLVPCYRKRDNVIGMYDLVRKIFLTNVGTGSFTKGLDTGNLADINSANWLTGYRTTSSGTEPLSGCDVTNFIGDGVTPFGGSTLYYKNITVANQRINFYNANKELVYTAYPSTFTGSNANYEGFDGVATEGKLFISTGFHGTLNTTAVYVRLCALSGSTSPIITLNEEIT